MIGLLVWRKLATLAELQTVYSTEDAYDLLEILLVEESNNAPNS